MLRATLEFNRGVVQAAESGRAAFVGQMVQKIERVLKQREYRPPENEEAPAEYRDLVERYFRALSED